MNSTAAETSRPTCPAPIVDNVPPEMQSERRWVVWKYSWRRKLSGDGYWTKVPYRCDGNGMAESNNPATWDTFDAALRTYKLSDYDGIGFMLGDGWEGIDLDDCLTDSESYLWGAEIVAEFNTYGEISPSLSGAKLIMRGRKPEWSKSIRTKMGPDQIGRLEVFDVGRFFAVTGQILDGKPCEVTDCTEQLTALCEKYLRADSGTNGDGKHPEPNATDGQYRRCLASMIVMNMQDSEDGSRRLHAAACRCVEHGLSDADAVRCIRDYHKLKPFPVNWTDAQIIQRIRDAERRTERGKVQPEESEAEITPLGALWKSDPELREVVIDGHIRRGQVGNLISTSKSYKTFLIIDLAISMAVKRFWLDTYPTIGGRVLIIDLELQRPDITRRTLDIAQALHAEPEVVASNIDVISYRGRSGAIDHIEKRLLALPPRTYALVIVDPLYKTYPAQFDENSNAQMTALYRRWERIAEHLDCGMLIVHHGTKGSQSEKRVVDVGAGASAQSRSADWHCALREHEVPDCVVMESRVRSFRPPEPIVLRWKYPRWERDLGLNAADLKTGKRRTKESAEADEPGIIWTPEKFAETFITADPKSASLILSETKAAEMSEREAKRLLEAAVEKGHAHEWVYATRGRPVKFANVRQPVTEVA